ncbi:MAG: two-component sensor histidine kinase [Betaproteobacteria bacterium HGW-Betaproteobacteria-11]|nr:MAG: two-component sensor histidine kinase [Betaproteobacteria bacterium HGW-Betaproteobacteria-11]
MAWFSLSPARRDLAGLVVLTVVVYLSASWFEASERLLILSRPFEFAQLDELPLTLLALSLGLVWFSWRRWQESRMELRARIAGERALAESREQLRLLTRQGVLQQEKERHELAQELHDELGQTLNAIKLDAVMIRNVNAESAASSRSRDAVYQAAQSVVTLTDHAYGAVRQIIGRLRPVALDELGLAVALEHLKHIWQRRLPALDIELDVELGERDIGEAMAMALYRIAQETLNNIVRHALAQRVRIRLEQVADGIALRIADDGCGFDSARRSGSGLGLLGMRERAEALGGCFLVHSAPGQGCEIEVFLPLAKGEKP